MRNMVASDTLPPGTRPDWESNWRPLGSQAALSPLRHTSQGYVESKRMGKISEKRDVGKNIPRQRPGTNKVPG